jgi:hypothetical protein
VKECGSKEKLPVPFFRTSNELMDRVAAEGMDPAHSSSEYFKTITERLKSRLMEAPGISAQALEDHGEIFLF